MPGDPEEYRRHAAHCAELAQSPELKKTLIALSKNWIKLATDMERSTALLGADGRAGERATRYSNDAGGAEQPERNR